MRPAGQFATALSVVLVAATSSPAQQEASRDVTPYTTLAILLLVLGFHTALRLSSKIRARREGESGRSKGRFAVEASKLGCLWGFASIVAVLFSVGSIDESDGMGAAGALLSIVGGFVFTIYGFTLALGALVGFFRFRPDRPGARWLRQALITGVVVGVVAALLCSVPFLVLGAERPGVLLTLALASGPVLFSVAVMTAVFWRARAPRRLGETARVSWGHSGLVRRSGVQSVLVLGLLWAPAVPMSAVMLYDWLRPGSLGPFNPALEAWGLPIWLVPAALFVGIWKGGELARRLALAMFLLAVLIQAVHVVGGLMESDRFAAGSAAFVLLVFSWPLWYLSRAEIKKAFQKPARRGQAGPAQ